MVLNIGTGTGIAIGWLVQTILKMMGSKAGVVVEQSRMRPEQSEVMELVCVRGRRRRSPGGPPAFPWNPGSAKRSTGYAKISSDIRPAFTTFRSLSEGGHHERDFERQLHTEEVG